MKCPYRKVTYHFSQGRMQPARDEEGFAECYRNECPYYYESYCSRVSKKGGEEK